ncbi:MAG: HEAT repeat domain-containing protein [Elusimicrobiota bacterium]|nr:HEAT repeat domain-containing protein [Elusimicrobiota bacterium]
MKKIILMVAMVVGVGLGWGESSKKIDQQGVDGKRGQMIKGESIEKIINEGKKANTKEEKDKRRKEIEKYIPSTKEDIQILLKTMREDKDFDGAAMSSLEKAKNPQLANSFIEAVDDKEQRIQHLSIIMCGRLKSREATPKFIKMVKSYNKTWSKIFRKGVGPVLDEEDFKMRLVAKALGEIGDDSAVPVLIDKLDVLKEDGVFALQNMGKKSVVAIIEKANKTKNDEERRNIAHIVAGFRDKEVAPLLLETVGNQQNCIEVRRGAAEGLGRVADKETLNKLIVIFKQNPDYKIRRSIVSGIEDSRSKDMIPFLIDVLKTDKDTSVRGTAAYVLGRLGDKTVIPALEEALNDKNSEVRSTAAFFLKQITGKDYKQEKR